MAKSVIESLLSSLSYSQNASALLSSAYGVSSLQIRNIQIDG